MGRNVRNAALAAALVGTHAMTAEQLPANGVRGSVDVGNLLQSFSGILSKVTRQCSAEMFI
jgi:hypothetical protein